MRQIFYQILLLVLFFLFFFIAIIFGISEKMVLSFISCICFLFTIYLLKIVAQAKKKCQQNILEIAVLGPSGAGKTTFSATLIQQLVSGFPEGQSAGLCKGVGYLDDNIERDLRKLAISKKDSEGFLPLQRLTYEMASTELKNYSQGKLNPTHEPECLYLKLLHGNTWYRLEWYDIPGSYFEEENKDFSYIKDILRRCHGVIFLIDSTKLLDNSFSKTELSIFLKNYFTAFALRMFSGTVVGKFPLWIAFTKGDSVLQSPNYEDELTRQTSQIIIPAKQHDERLELLVSTISANVQAERLYFNIPYFMGKFCESLWNQITVRQKGFAILKRWLIFWCLMLLYCSLETTAYWHFSELTRVQEADNLTISSAIEILNSLCENHKGVGLPSFYVYRKSELLAKAEMVQFMLSRLLTEKMETIVISQSQYHADLRLILDAIFALEKSIKILKMSPKDFQYQKHFAEYLTSWDKHIQNGSSLVKKLEFSQKIPQTQFQLKQAILSETKIELQKELDQSQSLADTYIGEQYYNDRLLPLIQWYKNYGGVFTDLDNLCNKYQNEHWDYCWQRFSKELMENSTITLEQQAEKLYTFFLAQPKEDRKTQHLGQCPAAIYLSWQKKVIPVLQKLDITLAKHFLLYERLQEQLEPSIKSEITGFQFDKTMRNLSRKLLDTTFDNKNVTLEEMEKSLQKFQTEFAQYRPEMAKIWQERCAYFRNPPSYEIDITFQEYGTNAKNKTKRWDTGILDKWYLYTKFSSEEKQTVLFLDLSQGGNFQGSIERKIYWKPWTKITISWLEADDDVDVILRDDIILYSKEFRNCLSLLDARTIHQILENQNQEEYWIKFDVKKIDEIIPAWLLEIYLHQN